MGFVCGFIFGIITLALVIMGVGAFYMWANRGLFPHGDYGPVPMIRRKHVYKSPYSRPWSTLYKKEEDSDEPESDDGLADTDDEI